MVVSTRGTRRDLLQTLVKEEKIQSSTRSYKKFNRKGSRCLRNWRYIICFGLVCGFEVVCCFEKKVTREFVKIGDPRRSAANPFGGERK